MEHKNNVFLGFILAFLAAILWGTVPIAVKLVLPSMSAATLVWCRFTIAGFLLFIFLFFKKKLPRKRYFLDKGGFLLLLFGTFGLIGNFLCGSLALEFISPTAMQVVGQFSSIGLMIFGAFFFKEKLKFNQIAGIFILIFGLGLFFNKNLLDIFVQFNDYSFGLLLGFSAAFSWVFYGVAQKLLLKVMSSQQILLIFYLSCSFFLLFIAKPTEIFQLNKLQFILLIYLGLNTFFAYGALAEAMFLWEVSKVSAIITLTPLMTLVFSDVLSFIFPTIFNFEPLNILGYIGAITVVAGAMITTIARNKSNKV